MRLTREQRAQVFAGNAPRIAGEGECPWKPGDVYRASPHVELTVLEIRTPKKGGWSLRYRILDRRDPARLIRPNPHPVDLDAIREELKANGGYPVGRIDDPAVSREAGIESAYTSNRGLAEGGVGEAVGEDWLTRFAGEANVRLGRERQAEYDRKMARSRAAAMKEAALLASRRGADVSDELATIDAAVEAMRKKAA